MSSTRPEKVTKICLKHFLAVLRETIKIAPKQCGYVSGAKPSHPDLVFKFTGSKDLCRCLAFWIRVHCYLFAHCQCRLTAVHLAVRKPRCSRSLSCSLAHLAVVLTRTPHRPSRSCVSPSCSPLRLAAVSRRLARCRILLVSGCVVTGWVLLSSLITLCRTDLNGFDFQLYLLWWYSGPKKSSKFNRNIFQPSWQQTIRIAL